MRDTGEVVVPVAEVGVWLDRRATRKSLKRDVTIYIFVLLSLAVAAILDFRPRTQLPVNEGIKTNFVDKGFVSQDKPHIQKRFNDINTFSDMWEFVNKVIIEQLFPDEPEETELSSSTKLSNIVGLWGLQIRQVQRLAEKLDETKEQHILGKVLDENGTTVGYGRLGGNLRPEVCSNEEQEIEAVCVRSKDIMGEFHSYKHSYNTNEVQKVKLYVEEMKAINSYGELQPKEESNPSLCKEHTDCVLGSCIGGYCNKLCYSNSECQSTGIGAVPAICFGQKETNPGFCQPTCRSRADCMDINILHSLGHKDFTCFGYTPPKGENVGFCVTIDGTTTANQCALATDCPNSSDTCPDGREASAENLGVCIVNPAVECRCINPWEALSYSGVDRRYVYKRTECVVSTPYPYEMDPGISVCYSVYNYGAQGCFPYDLASNPLCVNLVTGVPILNRPKWCDLEWCYIDVTKCNVAGEINHIHQSRYFPNYIFTPNLPGSQSQNLHYSYSVCGGFDDFEKSATIYELNEKSAKTELVVKSARKSTDCREKVYSHDSSVECRYEWKSSTESGAIDTSGRYSSYDPSGFFETIMYSDGKDTALEITSGLQANFIRLESRAIYFKIILYNPSFSKFSSVKFWFEIGPDGVIIPHFKNLNYELSQETTARKVLVFFIYNVVRIAIFCMAARAISIIQRAGAQFKDFSKQSPSFRYDFAFSLYDLTIIILFLVREVKTFLIYMDGFTEKLEDRLIRNIFYDMEADLDKIREVKNFIIVIFSLISLRSVKYLYYVEGLRLLGRAYWKFRTRLLLVYFSIIYFGIAFSIVGFILNQYVLADAANLQQTIFHTYMAQVGFNTKFIYDLVSYSNETFQQAYYICTSYVLHYYFYSVLVVMIIHSLLLLTEEREKSVFGTISETKRLEIFIGNHLSFRSIYKAFCSSFTSLIRDIRSSIFGSRAEAEIPMRLMYLKLQQWVRTNEDLRRFPFLTENSLAAFIAADGDLIDSGTEDAASKLFRLWKPLHLPLDFARNRWNERKHERDTAINAVDLYVDEVQLSLLKRCVRQNKEDFKNEINSLMNELDLCINMNQNTCEKVDFLLFDMKQCSKEMD
eukprot:g1890.t1